MAALARAEGVREVAPDGPWPRVGLAVDALLGTGAAGAPRAPMAALLERIARSRDPRGRDRRTHRRGSPDRHRPRRDAGRSHDHLRRAPPGAPPRAGRGGRRGRGGHRPPAGRARLARRWSPTSQAAEWLRRLRSRDHKGARGRVVVVGGDAGMTGAVRMAARAAFGAGAGLVHAVAPPDTVAALVQAEPDLQTLRTRSTSRPPRACSIWSRAPTRWSSAPGWAARRAGARWSRRWSSAARAVVLDADALVAFQGAVAELRASGGGRPLVLTPHPGEFRTLFPALAADARARPLGRRRGGGRESRARRAAQRRAHRRRARRAAAAHRRSRQPGARHRRQRRRAERTRRHRRSPRGSRPRSPPPSAPRPSAAPPTSPPGESPPAPPADGRGRALPDLWREWELLRVGAAGTAPTVLLELPGL